MQKRHSLKRHRLVPVRDPAQIVRAGHRQQVVAEQFLAATGIGVFDAAVWGAKPDRDIASPVDAKKNIRVLRTEGGQAWQQPKLLPVRIRYNMNFGHALEI